MLSFLELEAYLGSEYLHPGNRAATEILLQHLQIMPGERVLEIGCGTGATAALIARRLGARMVGMDLLPAMVAASRARTGIHLVQANGNHRLPFRDRLFDVLFAESVVALLDVPAFMPEAVRVLRPGGRLAMIERIWKSSIPPELAVEVNKLSTSLFGIPAANPHVRDATGWLETLALAGLQDVQALPLERLLPAKRSASPLLLRARRAWRYLLHPDLLAQSRHYKTVIRQTAPYWSYLESYFFYGQKAGC